ncbi:MAG TPA: hypothetical protein VFE85_02240, partial [Woeseiaceae bacterium]|nr:hypothetical protein [Woeseiaceae bacterium]
MAASVTRARVAANCDATPAATRILCASYFTAGATRDTIAAMTPCERKHGLRLRDAAVALAAVCALGA